jgi:hypothetical protein
MEGPVLFGFSASFAWSAPLVTISDSKRLVVSNGLCHYWAIKPHPEMIEGPEAWERFRNAMKAILKVPKSAMPASPYGKKTAKGKKPPARQG